MIIIKVSRRHGFMARTYKIDKFPCSIGRSPMNDITIDHDSVSSQHCLLEYQGDALIIKDCGSTNGILCQEEKITEKKIEGNIELVLGEITLKLILNFDQHDKTRVVKLPRVITHPSLVFNNWKITLGIVFTLIINCFYAWAEHPVFKEQLKSWSSDVLVILGTIFGLAGIFSLFSKIFYKDARFRVFLTFSVCWIVIISLWGILADDIFFLWSKGEFNLQLKEVVENTFLLVILFDALKRYFINTVLKKIIWGTVILFSLIIFSFEIAPRLIDEYYGSEGKYYAIIATPWKDYSPSKYSIEGPLIQFDQIFGELDSLRQEEIEKKKSR